MNHPREAEQSTQEHKYEMKLSSDCMYFVMDRDWSSASKGQNM